jgi:hypothetical protein
MALRSSAVGVFAASALLVGAAHATPVNLPASDPFIQLSNNGPNDILSAPGFGIFIGVSSLVPVALAGPSTTATLSTTNTITGAPILRALPYAGTTSTPGGYNTTISDNSGLYGPWTLTFTNGPDVSSVAVSLPPGATQLPAITNLTVSGSPANPTFDWRPPAGRPVEGYRINLFDQDLTSKSGTFFDVVLTRTITNPHITIPTMLDGGLTLDPAHRYTIQINALENRDGSNNLSNANVFARSRTYFDFTPASVGGPPFTYLPVIDLSGRFDYNVTNILTGTTIFVDPPVAVGYDYAIGAGNPNFRTVVLPTGIGDGKYDIYGFDTSGHRFILAKDWLGGDAFDFGTSGVDQFEVLGIELTANIDPSDTTAFVTGLSFVSSGDFTGSQTPITVDVGVPEPSAALLLAVGMLGLIGVRGARSQRIGER